MVKQQTHQTGHPRIVANVSGVSKPPVDWVTNTWSDAAREAAAEARREAAKKGGDDAQDQEAKARVLVPKTAGPVLSQLAERASGKASTASKYAGSQPSERTHQAAAQAHEDAAEAHGKASIRYGAEGNATMQKYHQGVAQGHEAKVDEHASKAEAAGQTKGRPESDWQGRMNSPEQRARMQQISKRK